MPGVLCAQTTNLQADIDWLTQPQNKDTFSSAGLTQTDRAQVLKQVEMTSLDVRGSWLAELRVGRVALGKSGGRSR